MSEFNRLALLVSDAPRAQEAAADEFRAVADWVPLEEADAAMEVTLPEASNTHYSVAQGEGQIEQSCASLGREWDLSLYRQMS